jgi:hypothetical protein
MNAERTPNMQMAYSIRKASRDDLDTLVAFTMEEAREAEGAERPRIGNPWLKLRSALRHWDQGPGSLFGFRR